MASVAAATRETPRLSYRYIILGAGCAGLSLIWYLLERGVTEPILILDRKESFRNDRTWCFWDVEPTPFTPLAAHRWPAWTIRTGTGETLCRTEATPYICLRSQDFYRTVQERISRSPNVHLRLGVRLRHGGYEETRAGVRVVTDVGVFEGDLLIDALAMGSPRFPAATERDINFLQTFRGQFITTDKDVFDSEQVTLMDFDTPQPARANRFLYVLPFGPRSALIENTHLLSADGGALDKNALSEASDPETNRIAIARYLRDRFDLASGAWRIHSEESGTIPMTTRRFPLRAGERIVRIGLAGGATRPSSGYTFLRIQRQCRALAAQLAAGRLADRKPPGRSRKHEALDAIFLEALRKRADLAPIYFQQLFGDAPSAAVVRFLTERDTIGDDLAVLRALPVADFARAAVRSAPLWFPRLWASE